MPLAVDGMKQCSTCKETKPVSEYYKKKNNADGYKYRCKSCQSKYAKKYRVNNKEKIRERSIQYRTENREKLNEYNRQYHQEVRKAEPCVYIATVHSTGYFYIGKTTNIIKERFRNHKKNNQTSLGKHINEHNLSLNDFEIEQYQCPSVEESTALERKLIAENIDNPLCLNKQIG